MDPNTAYRMMTEHLMDGDYSEAHDMATGLRDWVRKGGFLPDVPNRASDVPSALRRQVIAECQQVIDTAAKHIEA